MALQRSLHDAPLHASASPVDEANLAQTRGSRRDDVLLDHRWDVPGLERVEVDVRPDWNSDGVRRHLVPAHETPFIDSISGRRVAAALAPGK
jgi:hypothetical protein